jgi:hypothetical protein
MTEAPAPIEQAAKAAADARIAMSAAWLVTAFLDYTGARRRLSDDFHDSFAILRDELAEAGYLDRYRDPTTGALHLPPLEPSGTRAEKFGPAEPAESGATIRKPTLKGAP